MNIDKLKNSITFTACFLWLGAVALSRVVLADSIGQTVMTVNYENGALDSGVSNLLVVPPANPNAIQISSLARSGRYSIRTEVGSSNNYITEGKPRAESASMNIQQTRYSAGETWEYRFSVMLDKNWKIDPSGAVEIIWQFKRFSSGPDMFIAVKRDKIVLRYLTSEHPNNGQATLLDLNKVKPGQWMDFRLVVFWSAGTNGRAEVWYKSPRDVAYSPVATVNGPNMNNSNPKSAYLKWGLYRPECLPSNHKPCSTAAFNPRIVYHDDISATLISK